MSADRSRFLSRMRPGGCILDAGSGSGRDTLAFLKLGYSVSAFDASAAMCKQSTLLTGYTTCRRTFAQVDEVAVYDGVWASASLLHVHPGALDDAWDRLVRALVSGGSIYASFKLGVGERLADDGRTFFLVDEPRLANLVAFAGLDNAEIAVSRSLSGRVDERWLSVVATKCDNWQPSAITP